MGTQPVHHIKIYKQCVGPVYEYGSLSTITTLDRIISKIQRLQNKFIRLALRLPKYISVKLPCDSFGVPYVKDRLLSEIRKNLQEAFSREVNNIQQGQHCVGSFSNTALGNPPCKSLDYHDLQG